MSQPPSGIGPGAVTPFDPLGLNNAYTMAYGEDRDPYGAQMPYRIGYDTYTPNFPSIPGVPNSYAPGANPYATGFGQGTGSALPPTTGHAAPGPGQQNQQQQLQLQLQLQQHQQQLRQQQQQHLPQPPLQPPNQHYEAGAASTNDQSAVRQPFNNWYGAQGSASGLPQHQSQLAPTMPSSPPAVGDSSSRPNYSFGPRLQNNSPASSINSRTNTWDRPGSSNLSMRGPSLPSPIGTRPAAGGEDASGGNRPLSGAAMTGTSAGNKGRRW